MGLLVKKPEVAQLSPEVKGYGRVLDPTPLVGLINELATTRAAYVASSNELARLQTLSAQGNASERALQTAQATALRDQLAMQSAHDKLALSWGRTIADQSDLAGAGQSLTALQVLLIRVDLPMGEPMTNPPAGSRILTLLGQSLDAEVLGPAPNVDPQVQGRGYLLLLKSNPAQLAPGEAVTGYLKVPGEPLRGVVMPREAVVRTEGTGWVYVHTAGGEAFTRVPIPLDHPTEAGWFVTEGASPNDYVVVTGAQQLLSIEQKGQGGE
jgi:multidrug efflux pump subunit AcrA (membrane-fusion protein)